MARMIDADRLLDRFEKESKASDEHGRDFSFCFSHGGEPSAEWWAVMHIVEDFATVAEMEKKTLIFCENCRHWSKDRTRIDICGEKTACCKWFTRQGNYIETSAHDFCSYGCKP